MYCMAVELDWRGKAAVSPNRHFGVVDRPPTPFVCCRARCELRVRLESLTYLVERQL